MWQGFFPYYMRVAPHTILTFVFLEQMNSQYKQLVLGEEGGHGSSGI